METTKVLAFGPGGKFEEIKPRPALPLYSRVYCYGYAMSEGNYAIISEPDARGVQKTVSISEFLNVFGQIDSYSRPLSKKFGIGSYYDDISPDFRYREEDVNDMIERAKKADQKRKEESEAQAKKNKEEREKLPSLFKHLQVNPSDDHKVTKQNLVSELKHNFHGVKFSVRCDHYDSYRVTWTNGPSHEEVENVTDKFEDHHIDYTGDFMDYNPSNFNRVFGGFKFVSISREIEGIDSLREKFKTLYKGDEDPGTILYRIARKTSFPVNAQNFDVVRSEKTCGQWEDPFKITFEAPENAKTIKEELNNDVQIIDYSEKAIAVIGETKPVKDTLKDLGGRFNFHLSCGPGWIFPKTKETEVKKTLNI